MSTAAQRVAPDIVRETPQRETVLRDATKPVPQGWLKRFLPILTKEFLIVPVGQRGEEKEYAQRWPAQAIASTVVSSMAIVVMVTFSLFNNYSSATREDAKAFTDLKLEVVELKGEKRRLEDQLAALKDSERKFERDITTLKAALGLDIQDGTRVDKTPKEK